MIAPKDHPKEEDRLLALKSYTILDTLPEEDYDSITAIASQICGTPISLISLLDEQRQWFKSNHGLDARETPKELAFCAHAINHDDDIFIIPDSRTDERYIDNPLVVDNPHVIFYAGVPLNTEEGLPLGTLCVIDNKPRLLSKGQIKSLKALSKQVMNLLQLRKKTAQLEDNINILNQKNFDLEQFAYIAAHDLKSPLINISRSAKEIIKCDSANLREQSSDMLSHISSASDKLKSLVDGLLDYSKSESVLQESLSKINLKEFRDEIAVLFHNDNEIDLQLMTTLDNVSINKAALDQIIINLVGNAIKYSTKTKVTVKIGVSENETHTEFYVSDDGPGIAERHHDKIFQIFKIATLKDKFGKKGNGIGLATVKKIVERLGGTIRLESKKGEGSRFIFTIKK